MQVRKVDIRLVEAARPIGVVQVVLDLAVIAVDTEAEIKTVGAGQVGAITDTPREVTHTAIAQMHVAFALALCNGVTFGSPQWLEHIRLGCERGFDVIYLIMHSRLLHFVGCQVNLVGVADNGHIAVFHLHNVIDLRTGQAGGKEQGRDDSISCCIHCLK